ncbi:MAG: hypothetical protein IKP86_14035 [Anaerolineaceae bacterium]|nr:hypothetical protein [Anaerolineaceae bacterium]
MKKKRTDSIAFVLGIILIGCLIQAAGWMKGDRLVFPDVAEILRAFFRLLTEPKTWQMVWTTLRHLLAALAVSTVIGLVIGLAEGFSDFIRTMLRPLLVMLRSIPMLVLVVITMVLTKYERVPLIGTSLILIPLISEAVCEGCRHIDRELIDVWMLYSHFNVRILFSVYVPLMAGYLKQAYISAVGMGMKLVVSTEYMVQTRNSLGKAVNTAIYFNEYQDIYAYALIMIMMVIIVSEIPLLFLRNDA